MILVDSSVWIDYFNGRKNFQTDSLHQLLGTSPLLTGDFILAEVLQGFRADAAYRKALSLLESLDYADMFGRSVALKSAANYRFLRKQGISVRKMVDVIIGTFCIENDHILLHNDRDFLPLVEYCGLKIFRAS